MFLQKDGDLLFAFGGIGSGQLLGPIGCIFHDNKFIVSDFGYCLKVFDRSGKFLRKIGQKGNGEGQLNSPWGLCSEKCSNHHNILVCDCRNNGIVQFSVEGSFTGKSVGVLQQHRMVEF